MEPDPVAAPGQLTPSWLSAALGREVEAVDGVEVVGAGQMGACYRLTLRGDETLPPTVLAKLPSDDAGRRAFLAGMYGTEVRFYRDLAPTVAVRAPSCWYARIAGDGVFTLLLEDLAPAQPGDQLLGCSPAQAGTAAANLAGLHGPRWSDPALLGLEGMALMTADDAAMMQDTLPDAMRTTLAALGDRITPADAALLLEMCERIGTWATARPERFALVHGDYRLDNLMFGADGQVWTVDWQSISIGLPARDLAFLLGTGLAIADRESHEQLIVRTYHEALDVPGHSFDECWEDYRFGMVQIPLIVAFGCAYGARTDRGDAMFAIMLARAAAAMRHLGTAGTF